MTKIEKLKECRHWYCSTNPDIIPPIIVSELEYMVQYRANIENKINELVKVVNQIRIGKNT